MTREQMASAIRSHISNGLKEVYNHAYSIPQLEDEIGAVRNDIIRQGAGSPGFDLVSFSQKKDNIELDLVKPPYGGYSAGPKKVHHFQMPKLAMTSDNSALLYVGPADLSLNFKKYYDTDFTLHSYSRVIKNRPFVYIDGSINDNGNIDVYIHNLGVIGLREISVRAILDDPYKWYSTNVFDEDIEFPAPKSIQNNIIDILSAKYIEYYRKLNMSNQPNTQTETNK